MKCIISRDVHLLATEHSTIKRLAATSSQAMGKINGVGALETVDEWLSITSNNTI